MKQYSIIANKVFKILTSFLGKNKYETYKEINFESCRLLFRPFIFSELLMVSGFQEPYVKKILKLNPGETFVDCGAHIGTYTIPAAKKVGLKGKVISFEPHPYSAELLEKNVSLNKFTNVTIIKKPVTDKVQEILFNLSRDPSYSGIDIDFEKESQIKLTGIDLDTALINESKIDWLKIDVEGNEIKVLKGAEKTIKRFYPKIIIEVGVKRMEQVRNILESYDYHIVVLYNNYLFATTKIQKDHN